MPERWLRELRRLGGEQPPDHLWDWIQQRTGGRGPRHAVGHRLVAAVIALLVFAGAAYGVARAFLPNRRSGPVGSPKPSGQPTPGFIERVDVARIQCDADGTHVLTPVVRLQQDGLHVSIDNRSGADILEVRGFASAHLTGGENPTKTLAVPAGHVQVGCFTPPYESGIRVDSAYAPLTVVGPSSAMPGIHCNQPLTGEVPRTGGQLNGPLQGRILFELWDQNNDNADLYAIAPDGTGLTSILASSERESTAAWSPDGSMIAFVMGGDVWVANADGTGQRNLTKDGMDRTDDEPRWSPDGSRILFRSNRGQSIQLWLMNADGSDPVQLTSLGGYSGEGSWSPDGSKVTFASDAAGSGGPCSDLELYVLNADGTGARRLTDNALFDGNPVWSPDGSKIAFMRSAHSDYAWDVYVVNAEGSGEARLTDWEGFDGNPVWSPDGTLIAFASDRDATEGQRNENRDNANPVAGISIYVMNADGSGVTRVTASDIEGQAFPDDWRP
jgi:Tol biopolymer transport system component